MLKLVIALSALFALSACETLKGAGQDVTNAGEALDQSL